MNEAGKLVSDHGFAVAFGLGVACLIGWLTIMVFKRVLFDADSIARTWLNHHVLFIERTGEAMSETTAASREIGNVLKEHTQLIEQSSSTLIRLADLHDNPESKFSTVRTNETLHRVEDKVDWVKERLAGVGQ